MKLNKIYITLLIISTILGIFLAGTQIYDRFIKQDLSYSDNSQKSILDLKIQMDSQPIDFSSYNWQNNSLILTGNYTYKYYFYKGFSAPVIIRNEETNMRNWVRIHSSDGKLKYFLNKDVPYEATIRSNEVIIEKIGTTDIENTISFEADFSNLIALSKNNNFSENDEIIITTYPNITTRISPVDQNNPQIYYLSPKLKSIRVKYSEILSIYQSMNKS